MAQTPVLEDQWWGCYGASLKGWIPDAAFQHPAKFAQGLVERVYAHILGERWVQPGALVVDPMCGVAVGGVGAANVGLRWLGIELEPHFYRLGAGYDCPGLTPQAWVRWYGRYQRNPDLCQECQQRATTLYVPNSGKIPRIDPHRYRGTIDLHRETWARLRKPIPFVLQGDARNLLALVQEAGGVVTSPPYADGCAHTGGDDAHPELIQGGHTGHVLQSYSEPVAIVTSPPFGGVTASDYHLNSNPERLQKMYATYKAHGGGMTEATFHRHCEARQSGYSQHPTSGQLGNLPMGDVQAVISSPPYAEGLSKESTYRDQQRRKAGTRRNIMREKGIADAWYGEADGQIGKLRTGDLAAIVTSPPFERSTQVNNTPGDMTEGKARWTGGKDSAARVKQDYTEMASAGNLAHNAGEMYWKAMASIYAQCYQLLPVGGHIVLTLKGFIRKRQYVDLPGQTAQLLEHLGFRVLHMHRAMLTSQVAQLTLDGGEDRKSRKSFFRRLSEAKGAPAIDWETVLCAVKEPSHA